MKAYLEPGEVERLEQAAEYLRDKLLIRLLFHLGCRVSEALGIRVERYRLQAGHGNHRAPEGQDKALLLRVRRRVR